MNNMLQQTNIHNSRLTGCTGEPNLFSGAPAKKLVHPNFQHITLYTI